MRLCGTGWRPVLDDMVFEEILVGLRGFVEF